MTAPRYQIEYHNIRPSDDPGLGWVTAADACRLEERVKELEAEKAAIYDECMKAVAEECEEFGSTVVRAAYHAVKTLKRQEST